MPKLNIAGLVIDIKRENPILAAQINDYLTDSDEVDITVDFGNDYVTKEIEAEKNGNFDFTPEYSEYLAIYRYISTEFVKHGGFLMHGSAIAHNGRAYLFCAPSGTGKSTHSRMWREAFGDSVTMINDDKPIIIKKNGEFFACGTPWSGKHDLDTNTSVPLKAVVILARGEENKIERVKPESVLSLLFNQIYRPSDSEAYMNTIDLVSDMLAACPVYKLWCNISKDAALTALEELSKA